MDRKIELKLTNLIYEKIGLDPLTILPQSRIQEDLGADSLDTVQIIMVLNLFSANVDFYNRSRERSKLIKNIKYNIADIFVALAILLSEIGLRCVHTETWRFEK